jgi:hypothetical protein
LSWTGPDQDLPRGPNKALVSGPSKANGTRVALAKGPNPNNRRGPNPNNLRTPLTSIGNSASFASITESCGVAASANKDEIGVDLPAVAVAAATN